jgi:hypothetical protein
MITRRFAGSHAMHAFELRLGATIYDELYADEYVR